jgi:hypothetical protein
MQMKRIGLLSGLVAGVMVLLLPAAIARYVPPGNSPPGLEQLHKAKVILVVKLSADLKNGWKAIRPARAKPLRDGVFMGNTVKGKVVLRLKGKSGKTVALPTGLNMIEARKGEHLLLLVREAGGRRWVSAFQYVRANVPLRALLRNPRLETDEEKGPAANKTAKAFDPLKSAQVFHVQIALKALAQPTKDAALKFLDAEAAKLKDKKQPVKAAMITQIVRRITGQYGNNFTGTIDEAIQQIIKSKGTKDCLPAIYFLGHHIHELSVGQVRQLVAKLKTADAHLKISWLTGVIEAKAKASPAFLGEMARDKALPADVRARLYTLAAGILDLSSKGGYFENPVKELKLAEGFTRDEIIAFFKPLATVKDPLATKNRSAFFQAMNVLSVLKWDDGSDILVKLFQTNRITHWSDVEQLVRLMGAYDDAIQIAMDAAIDYRERKLPKGKLKGWLMGVVNGLAWSGHPDGIAFVRKLSKQRHPVIGFWPKTTLQRVETQHGVGYTGRGAGWAKKRLAALEKEIFAEPFKMRGSRADVKRKIGYLVTHGDRKMLERLWEMFATEGGDLISRRADLIGGVLRGSRDPWVIKKMAELWNAEKGTHRERYAFSVLKHTANKNEKDRIAFMCKTLLDTERGKGTRSFAAQLLRHCKSEQAVRALYKALKSTTFTNPYAQKFIKMGRPVPDQYKNATKCEVHMLPESFLAACLKWGDPKAIDLVLEMDKAGRFRHAAGPVGTLMMLDPTFKRCDVFERIVRTVCTSKDRTQHWVTNARVKLDSAFGVLFFAAKTDVEEKEAWLAAWDTGKLDRSAGKHWVFALPAPPMLKSDRNRGGEGRRRA